MSSSNKLKGWGSYRIGDMKIKNSESKRLLGIKVDTKLNFN